MLLFVGNVGIDRIILVWNGKFLINEFVGDEIYSYICNLVALETRKLLSEKRLNFDIWQTFFH